MVDYQSAIKKPFTDASKLIIGMLLSLIPILNLFSLGFILETSGYGKAKASKKMPEWKGWTYLFFKGLFSFVISAVYMAPGVLVAGMAVGVTLFSLFAGVLGPVVNSDVIESAMADDIGPSIAANLESLDWISILRGASTAIPLFMLAGALLAVGSYVIPIATLNYLKKKKLSAAFDLSLILKKSMSWKYFAVRVVIAIISLITVSVFKFIPVIGIGMNAFIVGVISYTLYGEVLRELKF